MMMIMMIIIIITIVVFGAANVWSTLKEVTI
jgi:hypothetical protein